MRGWLVSPCSDKVGASMEVVAGEGPGGWVTSSKVLCYSTPSNIECLVFNA